MAANDGSRILTVPDEIKDYRPLFPTGNLFVSLPIVSPADGSVERVNLLHMQAKGLVEFAGKGESGGKPLLAPWLGVEGQPVELEGRLEWEQLEHWIPRFRFESPDFGLALTGTIYAPVGHKGFVYVLEVENTTGGGGEEGESEEEESPGRESQEGEPIEVSLGLDGLWCYSLQTLYTSRHLNSHHHVYYNKWSKGPIFETRPGTSLAALAASASDELDWCGWRRVGGVDSGAGLTASTASPLTPWGLEDRKAVDDEPGSVRPGEASAEVRVPEGEGIYWALGKTVRLEPGESYSLAFHWACNQEGDGARTTAVDLARHGWRKLLEETRQWLKARQYQVPGDHESGDGASPDETGGNSHGETAPLSPAANGGRLTHLLNLNNLFNYFFAQGYTIDTEDLVLVTSRSPRYYVSAAFWARDALLWSFPAILLVDKAQAREALYAAFTRYMKHAGIHSLYIDGSLLYPGFELDELAAYLIALHYYVKMTDDKEILTEPWVKRGVSRVMSILRTKKHRQVDLYETFLYPSDDPAEHPYVTYDNVVAWRALQIAARLYTAWGDEEMRAWAAEQAEALAKAIRNHCIVEGPLGPMYAWCVDPDTGECTIYDEPPGSLRMLHYYGFCRLDDPIYQNTVRWIFSEHNPHYYPEARFNEVGCPHTDEPFVMGLFNGLLNGGVDQALEILRTAELDAGLACEGFDRQTGIVKTGAGFATCSGFLAYAMWYALVRKPA